MGQDFSDEKLNILLIFSILNIMTIMLKTEKSDVLI